MIWEDLGAVSTYAIAQEKGYLGTKEEFAQMLINAATLPDVDKIVQSAQKATEESKNQTKEAQILTETIKKQTNHISFSINSEDGGLDIVYTE